MVLVINQRKISMASNNVLLENEKEERKCTLFDIYMIPCKILFLLYGGITGSIAPYINIFFVSVGLSASQAGVLTGIPFISATIASPLWGLLADYT